MSCTLAHTHSKIRYTPPSRPAPPKILHKFPTLDRLHLLNSSYGHHATSTKCQLSSPSISQTCMQLKKKRWRNIKEKETKTHLLPQPPFSLIPPPPALTVQFISISVGRIPAHIAEYSRPWQQKLQKVKSRTSRWKAKPATHATWSKQANMTCTAVHASYHNWHGSAVFFFIGTLRHRIDRPLYQGSLPCLF